MSNYRVFNDNVSSAAFAKQADGSWATGTEAKAGHDVELRFDRTTILWSLPVS